MRLKLDENIPPDLALALSGHGHDVETVASEGLSGADDDSVIEAAIAEQRALVTQDVGIADIRRLREFDHFGVVLLRYGEMNRQVFFELVLPNLLALANEDLSNGVVVMGETKSRFVRILRP